MSHAQEVLKTLNTEASGYLREATIVVQNDINPEKGTTLGLTLAQFFLTPGGGSWATEPVQGKQIIYGQNPGQWVASNTTYPGEAKGFMVFAVQSNATLRIDFESSLTGYGATINGQSSVAVVSGFYFRLVTTLQTTTSQPIYTVTAFQYN